MAKNTFPRSLFLSFPLSLSLYLYNTIYKHEQLRNKKRESDERNPRRATFYVWYATKTDLARHLYLTVNSVWSDEEEKKKKNEKNEHAERDGTR